MAEAQTPKLEHTTCKTDLILIKVWLGKPKGLKQILWERGWINETQLNMYQKVAVDKDGGKVIHLPLLRLMEQCLNFFNEVTEMEIMAEKMGVCIMVNMKYHTKLVDEGVGYTWGAAKCRFWAIQILLKMKEGRAVFSKNVRSVLSTNRELSIDNIRRFSKRTRSYMLLYFTMGNQEMYQPTKLINNTVALEECDNFIKIENMVDTF